MNKNVQKLKKQKEFEEQNHFIGRCYFCKSHTEKRPDIYMKIVSYKDDWCDSFLCLCFYSVPYYVRTTIYSYTDFSFKPIWLDVISLDDLLEEGVVEILSEEYHKALINFTEELFITDFRKEEYVLEAGKDNSTDC